MGILIDGTWHDDDSSMRSSDGAFKRNKTTFRNWITPDGGPGPSGKGGFAAESGRYHLYVSYACPWAHRALVFRAIKGLEDHIGVSVVHPEMLGDGWTFETDFDGATGDQLFDLPFARDLYTKAAPKFSGRVTVPILWDKQQDTIVSNESSEIIRMFNTAFNDITGNTDDYWPEHLHDAIEPINERVYDTVNNGVDKAGFATTQDAYEEAVHPLFDSLDWIEDILSKNRYLVGDTLTEADWRLFTTLVRFDKVYNVHFKCSHKRIVDYPNLWAYTRELYQVPGVAETVHFDHIVRHYYFSHDMVNPNRIVPFVVEPDFTEPHGRG